MNASRPFLVTGHPRSGTTVLTRLLNTHPELEATFELGAFQRLDTPYTEYRRDLRLGFHDRPVRSVGVGSPRARIWASRRFVGEFRFRLWRHRREVIGLDTVAGLLSSTLRHALVGDKLPDYVFQLDDLARREGLRRIVIVRDCRLVTASTLARVRTAWRGRSWTERIDTPVKVAENWVRAMESLERNLSWVHVLRLEDLVDDPQRCVEGLGAYLEVEASAFDTSIVRRPDPKPDQILDSSDIAAVEAVAGQAMLRWGYGLHGERP